MGKALNKWLKLTKKVDIREETLLNVQVTSHFIDTLLEKVTDEFGITAAQYNVLRILMGVYPEGHPRCEIISRMIERAPDTTRLIDRLEKQGLLKETEQALTGEYLLQGLQRKELNLLMISDLKSKHPSKKALVS